MSLAAAPRFSVVIPLYNKAAYVREAVHSVLAQSHPPFEVIVVDDGSIDDGAALVKDLAPGLLRVVRQDNAGVAVARNRGIAEAQGDHIVFLDADDRHDGGYLAAVAALISAFPQAGVHATAYRCAWPDGRRLLQSLPLPRPALISDFYRQWCDVTFTFTSAITVRRSLLLSMDVMFPPGERLGEDQDLWFRLAERTSFAYDPRALVEYRMEVSDSATASIQANDLLPCYRRLGQRLTANKVPRPMQAGARRLLAAHYINTARFQLMSGRRSDALALLRAPEARRIPIYWLRTWLLALRSPRGGA